MSGDKILLVNCDDFGIHPGANRGVVEAVDHGIAVSCSLMVPCPAADEAMRILADRPDLPFGVHLTLVADFPDRPWAPLTSGRSLLDPAGRMFTPATKAGLVGSARIDEVETEFRAQLETALDRGLEPVHLDWHCLADGGREDIFDVTLALADEYGLAIRGWLDPARRVLRSRGRPVVDHPFLDSFALPLDDKQTVYADRLRSIRPGLTEWAVHPAYEESYDPGAAVRRTDLDFLVSATARDIVAEQGITLIGWPG